MQAYDWGDAAKPFTKWAGGKTALLHKILPRLPEKINAYYEPFLGGGAVFFALAAEGRFDHAVISDANGGLMNAYAMLADTSPVIRVLKKHERLHSDKHYYAVRAQKPRNPTNAAARFIYLNRTCFNGLYRVNRQGTFNVPVGRYTNPTICNEGNLRAVGALMSSVMGEGMLAARDFEDMTADALPGDAVYFDPPYVPLSGTSDFTAFTKGGFDEAEQVRLRDCFKSLDELGVHVLLSNSNTPLVRRLYKGFRISKVKAPRRINSKGAKRGDVTELLISGRNAR